MELVEFFKDEVNSIVDHRPPVSKAKMVQITRAAIKATRFYKHVVMAVERFIERCPPEYKISGLYVIDSIVRQSRHQNGKERDIFGPRFSRNLHITFDNLFSGCLREDRPRIVRVLNLWQKNGVFNVKVIQPLLDLANIKGGSGTGDGNSSLMDETTNSIGSNQNELSQNLIAGNNSSGSGVLNMNNSSINISSSLNNINNTIRISKSVLDFDYGEDDDDDADETPTEAEPPLSSTLNKIEMEQRRGNDLIDNHTSSKFHSRDRDSKQSPQNHSQHSLSLSQMNKTIDPDPVLERWNKLMKGQSATPDTPSDTNGSQVINTTTSNSLHGTQQPSSYSNSHRERTSHNNSHGSHTNTSSSNSLSTHHHHSKHNKQTARPITPSSGSPKTKSPTCNDSSKNKVNEAEREAERRRKCLPKIKDRHLTLCSSTLWLGHVPKSVTEADISDAFGEFGTINSIDLIPPRGCSYVCMDRRQDAKKALSESRELRLKQSRIKMAWAPGKGLKEYKDLKDYFELPTGCAYIPYSKITLDIDFDILEEGGVIDEDSMSMEMIELRKRRTIEKLEKNKKPSIAPNMNLPIMPILQQSIPSTFHLPPTSLTNVPPPSTAWVHGQSGAGIPFPPPRLTNASSLGKIIQPPTSITHDSTPKVVDNNDQSAETPISLEHKISITEQQISMVEQQLNMMQQSQASNMGHSMSNQLVAPHLLNQADPFANSMIFDMGLTQGMAPMPPQMQMFSNPPPGLFGQPAPLIPISQANQMNMTIEGGSMHQYDTGY